MNHGGQIALSEAIYLKTKDRMNDNLSALSVLPGPNWAGCLVKGTKTPILLFLRQDLGRRILPKVLGQISGVKKADCDWAGDI